MLVVVEDGGGLANRLFVFTNVIVTGLATGHRVANPAFRHWAESFEGTAGDALSFHPRRKRAVAGDRVSARIAASLSYRCCRILAAPQGIGPVRAVTLRWPERCDLDDPETAADIRRRRLVLFKGWLFRNRSGIERSAGLIRDFFRPVAAIREEADRCVESARRRGEVLVGVHIRRRDYRSFMNGRYFYDVETYRSMMRSVAEMVSPRSVSFLVCTDEPQEPAVPEDLPWTTSSMGPVHDIWALSRCDLLMGPPSTFSTWAAFLGEVPRWEIGDPGVKPETADFVVPLPLPRTPEETRGGMSSVVAEEDPNQRA